PAGSRVHPGDVVGRITEAVTAERAAPVTAGRTGAPSEPSRSVAPRAEPRPPREPSRSAEPPRSAESPRAGEPPRAAEPRGDGERTAEPSRAAATAHDGDGRGGAARAEDDAEREPMSQLRRTIAARLVEALGLAALEQAIADVARRAREGKLAPGDLVGGTFTITNGGVFGSLLSTPILNPPQSGILGMHKIEDRPVVRGGQVVIRPMMYV